MGRGRDGTHLLFSAVVAGGGGWGDAFRYVSAAYEVTWLVVCCIHRVACWEHSIAWRDMVLHVVAWRLCGFTTTLHIVGCRSVVW